MAKRLKRLAQLAVVFGCLSLLSAARGGVVINEFMASNGSTVVDEDGDFEDWIELHNPTSSTVDLTNWYLTTDRGDLTGWRFPAVSLGPGEFLIVFASGKDRAVAGSELHTDFRLDSDGEYLALVMDDGYTTVSEFSPVYPPQRRDISYGLGRNATSLVTEGAACRYLVPPNGADESTWFLPGFGDGAWSPGVTGLGFQTVPPAVAHWTFDVDATDSDGTNHGTLQNGASIAGTAAVGTGAVQLDGADDYVAIGDPPALQITGQITIAAWINANATNGIRNIVAKGHTGSPNGEIFLRINNGNYQIGSWNGSNHMTSFGGAAADVGSWVHLAGTYDGTNWNLYLNGSLVSSNADATGAVPVNENWAIGARGTGTQRFFSGLIDDVYIYNRGLTAQEVAFLATGLSGVGTDVRAEMLNINASLWTRIPFNVADPAAFESLLLRVKYEDGFRAYLNGVEIASRNAPAPAGWNAAALGDRPNDEARTFEEIDVSGFLSALNAGPNVLAVHGLNDAASNGDFLILPELIASAAQNTIGYFPTPTPGRTNTQSFAGFVAPPDFSIGRGFYAAAFDLVVSCETLGSTISYTLDGSEPTLTSGVLTAAPDAFSSPSVTIPIAATTAVRAAAFKEGLIPSVSVTHTYVFVDDVVLQTYQATLDAGFPTSWKGTAPDYGMDPDVIDFTGPDLFGGVYAATVKNDLKAVPTLSIAMNVDDMFGPDGIYSNPTLRGIAWERPTSLELIYPDGREGFQVNCGIRIQGGAFRRFNLTKKNSFRVLFKGLYGPTKLEYPFFGSAAVDQFDNIIFRMNSNDGWQWSAAGDKPQYARDEFGRRTQLAMGQASSHGNFMHLYINGIYWGMYNPVERPDSSFCAMYYGGEKENWDAYNTGGVIEGNWNAWNSLLALSDDVVNATTGPARTAAYMKAQGLNPDGSNNPAWESYVDVDNLIDYMICNLYVGNTDWPHKNYYFARERGPDSTGFKFFMWDSEWSIDLRSNVDTDRTGVDRGVAQPYDRLKSSAEFRLRFADHVHKHFFNGGALYVDEANPAWDPAHPERNRPAARYAQIIEEIREALVPESARWGDQHRTLPYTRDAEWQAEVTDLLTNWFPRRSANVLVQFQAAGLYPYVAAPVFEPQHGGVVPAGFALTMSAPAGMIYYTLDGSDPREIGGGVSGTARAYGGPLTLNHSVFASARVLSGGVWSALNSAAYIVQGAESRLKVTEVMYDPPAGGDFEYIEIHNPHDSPPAVLDGYAFTNGVFLTIPDGTVLQPGDYLLVVGASSAGNFGAFRSHYGLDESVKIVGSYNGGLRNSGERVTLSKTASGPVVLSFEYRDGRGWPVAADGAGHSLVPVNVDSQPAGSLDYGGNWRASAYIRGSPGAADPVLRDMVLNEVVANTSVSIGLYDSNDQIEIFNISDTTIPMQDWYLSDNEDTLTKWHIGSSVASIPPGGRLAFDEINHFNSPTPGSGFGISKSGERLYLSHLPAGQPQLHRVADAVRFKGQEPGVSLSRYPDGNPYWSATAPSVGSTNTAPIADVIVSEFMYNPGTDQGVEFIEIHNPTASAIPLENGAGTWRIDGGVDFAFPPGAAIPAGGRAVLVPFNPSTDVTSASAFRAAHGLAAGEPALVYGPYTGKLSNQGERIAVERPQAPTRPGELVSWVIVDEAIYFDQAPWTPQADGTGLSLHRVAENRAGNDPVNWTAGPPNPGSAVSGVPVGLSSSDVAAGGLTSVAPVNFRVVFGRAVNGFGSSDVDISNGGIAAGSFSGADGETEFSFAVNPFADGLVTVRIPAGVSTAVDDAAPNTASTVFAFTYDGTRPSATPPRDSGGFSPRTEIAFYWDSPADANGIAAVVLHVGTAPGQSDVAIIDVTGRNSQQVTAPDQSTAYAYLVVTDSAGNVATTGASDGIRIDASGSLTRTRRWHLFD